MRQIVAAFILCSFFISCSDKKILVEEEKLNFEKLSIDNLLIGRSSGIMYNDSNILLSDILADSLFHLINLKERTSCQVHERSIPELARAMAYQGKLSVSPDGCYLVHAIYSTPMIWWR